MKKRVFAVAVAVISVAAILMTINIGSNNRASAKEESQYVKPTPLVIDNSKVSSGKITIYQEEKVLYEYQGPIQVWRRNGEYFIEVHTIPCSCSEGERDSEVGENE